MSKLLSSSLSLSLSSSRRAYGYAAAVLLLACVVADVASLPEEEEEEWRFWRGTNWGLRGRAPLHISHCLKSAELWKEQKL